MFRLTGKHPGADAAVATAGSLARMVRLTLLELCDRHLLTEHTHGRRIYHVIYSVRTRPRCHRPKTVMPSGRGCPVAGMVPRAATCWR